MAVAQLPTIGSTTSSYEIVAKLATGGMAELFLARVSAAGVERYVVLKRVLHHRAQDIHAVQMFVDEARLAAQLHHANIAQVLDIGKLGDSFFFTMEYVHGETVAGLVQHARRCARAIPISCVLAIVVGAASGLHHAHERIGRDGTPLAIVHRDVSPSNLLVSYEGIVKLVDFGVAKAIRQTSETRSGVVKGKIGYLSPEQCRGGEIDRRSDLFSLGIVMWELLTGERLFKRTTDYEHMEAIVTGDIAAPSTIRPEVSPSLDAIVMRLLAKAPEDRHQTADELVEAIDRESVSLGTPISASVLGRFVRDLMGHRSEPWLELHTAVGPVTVTTEPVPDDISIPIRDELVRELASLPDLSAIIQRPTDIRELPVTRSYRYGAYDVAAGLEQPRRHAWFAWLAVSGAVAGVAVAIVLARDTAVPSYAHGGVRPDARVSDATAADAPADSQVDAMVHIATPTARLPQLRSPSRPSNVRADAAVPDAPSVPESPTTTTIDCKSDPLACQH